MNNLDVEYATSALRSKIGLARNDEELNDLMLQEVKKMKKHMKVLGKYLDNQYRRLNALESQFEKLRKVKETEGRKKERKKKLVTVGKKTRFYDSTKRRICIGDEVEIVTEGRHESRTGVITATTPRRLEIRDQDGVLITRAPRNLMVRSEKSRDNHSCSRSGVGHGEVVVEEVQSNNEV